MRLDHQQRPELNKGTVDFAVSEEYWAPHPAPRIIPLYQTVAPEPTAGKRVPQAMDFVFAFDVSAEAVQCGFTHASCLALLDLLYPPAAEDGSERASEFPSASKIAILSYDRTLHFYDLSVRLSPSLVVARSSPPGCGSIAARSWECAHASGVRP